MKRIFIAIFLAFLLPCSILSQDVKEVVSPKKLDRLLIKTNALAAIFTMANIGAEINLNDKFSVELPIYYTPYDLSSYQKVRVFIVQPELKYWLNHSPFDGHYFGANISTGWFNVAMSKKKRYQDNKMIMGIGLTYGYYYPLLDFKFLLGAHVGVGYNRFSYDIYNNSDECKKKIGMDTKNYWGITQIGLSIAYKINLK